MNTADQDWYWRGKRRTLFLVLAARHSILHVQVKTHWAKTQLRDLRDYFADVYWPRCWAQIRESRMVLVAELALNAAFDDTLVQNASLVLPGQLEHSDNATDSDCLGLVEVFECRLRSCTGGHDVRWGYTFVHAPP